MLRPGTRVRLIVVENGVAVGVEVDGSAGPEGPPVRVDADVVVSAADLHHTETRLLTDPGTRTYPERWWSRRVAGPSALLLLLGVKGDVPELEHHTLLFSKDWHANFDAIFGDAPRVPDTPSLYVCKPSGVDDSPIANRGCLPASTTSTRKPERARQSAVRLPAI